MKALADLRVKLFADGAEKAGRLEMYHHPLIQGFTTNPTLMRKADILDYHAFALDIVRAIPDCPISFEAFSDDFGECPARPARSRNGVRTSTSKSPSPTPGVSHRSSWSARWHALAYN